jgi:hypothetical protein
MYRSSVPEKRILITRVKGSESIPRGGKAENLYQIRLSGLEETAIAKAKFYRL